MLASLKALTRHYLFLTSYLDFDMKKSNSAIASKILLIATIVLCLTLGIVMAMHPSKSGIYLERKGKFAEAIQLYSDSMNNPLYKNDPRVYLARAYCNRRIRRFKAALEDLEIASRLAKTHWFLYGIPGLTTSHSIEYCVELERGWTYYKGESYEVALKHFSSALKLEKQASAYCGRAAVHEALGKDAEALEDYAQAIECGIAQDKELAYHERAIYYRNHDQTEEAISDLTTAVTTRPCMDAYIDRGKLYRKQGKNQEAVDDFSRAIRITSTELAYHERALAYFELKDFRAALSDIDRAIELDPTCKFARAKREKILKSMKAP